MAKLQALFRHLARLQRHCSVQPFPDALQEQLPRPDKLRSRAPEMGTLLK